MSVEKITEKLVDAFSLLDLSEKLIEDYDDIPLAELPRVLSLLKKNIRDAKKLINDAEKELDEMVKEIDEAEEVAEVVQ